MQVAQHMNESHEREIVQKRVSAAVVTFLTESPRRSSTSIATWLMIDKFGHWPEVVVTNIFKMVPYDERLVVLPLALGEGLASAGADNLRMKKLCEELDPNGVCPPECSAFVYLSALLVGSTVIRPYHPNELVEMKCWLRQALATNFPDITPEFCESALKKFEPFFSSPNVFQVPGKNPAEVAVLNTLVAIHTASTTEHSALCSDYSSAALAAEKFYSACRQKRVVN
jgi:hypothetical protein